LQPIENIELAIQAGIGPKRGTVTGGQKGHASVA
jgi:hypothetical protein